MDTMRFASPIRLLGRVSARRRLLLGLAGSLAGVAAGAPAGAVRRKKPRLNAFGCVDVGKPCRGDDGLCCSGVCQGRKPTKGRKDRSRCVAHHASTCQAGQRSKACGGAMDVVCASSTSEAAGVCFTTTGNAPYCSHAGECHACSKDTECRAFCGEAAACVLCTSCTMTGGTACVGSAVGACTFPPS